MPRHRVAGDVCQRLSTTAHFHTFVPLSDLGDCLHGTFAEAMLDGFAKHPEDYVGLTTKF